MLIGTYTKLDDRDYIIDLSIIGEINMDWIG